MNKMTFIGWIGLTALACQSNTEGYQIKGNIEGAGNGIAIMTLPVGREEPTTGDTVKMKNGVFTFTGKLEAPSWSASKFVRTRKNRHLVVLSEKTTQSLSLENGLMFSTNTGIGVFRMLT